MRGLTWLHISDWHQAAPDSDRAHIRTKLKDDIERCRNQYRELSEIDFVVVSGDVTNSGRHTEFEQAVEHLFKPLMEPTGLNDSFWEKLIVVPGNHDFDQRVLKAASDEILLDPLGKCETAPKRRAAIKAYLDDAGKRMLLLSPFRNFRRFVTEHLWGQTDELNKREPAYYQVKRIRKEGMSIGIIGFNTALLSNRHKNDYGHLVIGELPLGEGLGKIAGDDIRIAVMHHPISWLADFDRDFVEERLFDACHFVLHGHQHLQRVHVISSTIGDTVNIPAGTVYDRRFSSNPRYMNSYNFTHIDLETLRGTVYLRHWEEQKDSWAADSVNQDDGHFHFTLPKRADRSKGEVYQKQVSSFVGKTNRRFFESYAVKLKNRVHTKDGVSVVRHEATHKVRLAPGAPETFVAEVELSGKNRFVVPAQGTDADGPADNACSFKLNEQRLSTYKVEGNKIVYTTYINRQEATVEYSYVLYMNPEDFFIVRLKRFAKNFKLEVDKDASLSYEFVKLGDIPAEPYRDYPTRAEYRTEEGGLCSPGQGFIVHWYRR